MKKTFITIILCVSMLVSVIPTALADTNVVTEGTIGDVSYCLTSDGVFTLSGVGETANHSNATGSNPSPWASYLSQIKTLVVEEGVTMIGNNIFRDAVNMTSVSLPSTLTTIGEACFRDCTGLKSVTLPESLTTLKRVAFFGCTSLEEIIIAGSFSQLADKLFTNCSSLKKLTIPVTITSLADTKGTDAFAGVSASADAPVTVTYGGTRTQWENLLTTYSESVLASEHVTVICTGIEDDPGTEDGGEVSILSEGTTGTVNYKLTSDGLLFFSGTGATDDYSNANKLPYYSYMNQIKKVVVEEGVTHLGTRLFYGASAMESISIADSVTSIGEACFRQCASLKTVTLPDDLATLSRVAFYSCTGLEDVDLGETVTVLGDKAFNGCGNLTKLTIPATLTTLEANNNGTKSDAFVGISVTDVSVTYGGTVSQWKDLLATYDSVLGKEYVTVTCSDGIYNSADDTGEEGNLSVLCSGTIGDVNYTLTSNGVFTLSGTGETANHSNATGTNPVPWAGFLSQIKTLVVEDGVTMIGNNLFRDAVNLKTISLPNSVTTIGQCCFQDCTSLKSVMLP